jgi:hypothetical protein
MSGRRVKLDVTSDKNACRRGGEVQLTAQKAPSPPQRAECLLIEVTRDRIEGFVIVEKIFVTGVKTSAIAAKTAGTDAKMFGTEERISEIAERMFATGVRIAWIDAKTSLTDERMSEIEEKMLWITEKTFVTGQTIK